MKKMLKGFVGAAVVAGVATVAYKMAFTPQAQKVITESIKKAFAGIRETVGKMEHRQLSITQQSELEKNKAWIKEQWKRAGF